MDRETGDRAPGGRKAAGRRFRPSRWLTLFAALGFSALCGLGLWQLQRLTWKTGLITEMDAARQAPPLSLPAKLADPEAMRFRTVSVTGRFVHEAEAHRIGRVRKGEPGYRIFTPLKRDNGETVMIERGWAPKNRKDPATRPEGRRDGPVTITGMLRLPEAANRLIPDNDLANNIWFASDPVGMAAAAGLVAAPFYVVDEQPGGAVWPKSGPAEINLRNNHLGYALTWFTLAAALAAIWVVLGLQRGRRTDAVLPDPKA